MTYARSRIYDLGEPERPTPAQREAAIQALRREAWRKLGLVILDPAEVADDWLRQALRNEAQRQFGGGR